MSTENRMANRKASIVEPKTAFLKKGMPVALAFALAISVFTACDAFDESEHESHATGGEASVSDDVETAPADPGFYESVWNQYGIYGGFANISFVDLLETDEGENRIKEEYSNFCAMVERGEIPDYELIVSKALWQLMDLQHFDSNIALNLNNVSGLADGGWSHTIVSAGNDFAFVSKDSLDNAYITGFKDGAFLNELKIVSQEEVDALEQIINEKGYDSCVEKARLGFLGFLQLLHEREIEGTGICAFGVSMAGVHNNYIIKNINFYDKLAIKTYLEADVKYGVSDNYIDRILSGHEHDSIYVPNFETKPGKEHSTREHTTRNPAGILPDPEEELETETEAFEFDIYPDDPELIDPIA